MGPRARDRRRHPRAAQVHRQLGRLEPHLLYAGRGALACRARGVRAAVRGGTHLSGPLHHQLVPALPHRALQRGSREGGDGRKDLAPALPARRRERARHGGHHPSRDHAGRHRRGGAPGGRAVSPSDRPRADPARGGPPRAHHRRRGGGSRLRLGRGQGHASARSRGLRDRPPARAAVDRRDDAGGAHQPRRAGSLPGTRPVRRPGPGGGGVRGGGAARADGAAPPRGRPLLPLQHGDRAAPLRPVVRPDGAAGPPGAGGLPRRHPALHPRAARRRLLAVARGYPRLVHLPPALVGAPHPGVVLRGRRVRPHDREPDRPRRVPRLRRAGAPG